MRRTTIADLPPEVLLEYFSFMELKSLIISRCVCAGWRELVPKARLLHAQRRLLDLYYGIVNTDCSLKTRDYALERLQPFDRQAYIDYIILQYPTLPDDFRLWVLEWPSDVVIHDMWPGLPTRLRPAFRPGVNCLGSPAPQVSALVYHIGTPDVEFIPGILVWKAPSVATWLILDERSYLFGRIISLESVPRGRLGDKQGFEGIVVADWNNWIEYLLVAWSRSTMNSCTAEDFTYVKCGIRRVDSDIPPPPWSRRHEEEFQSRLKTNWL